MCYLYFGNRQKPKKCILQGKKMGHNRLKMQILYAFPRSKVSLHNIIYGFCSVIAFDTQPQNEAPFFAVEELVGVNHCNSMTYWGGGREIEDHHQEEFSFPANY